MDSGLEEQTTTAGAWTEQIANDKAVDMILVGSRRRLRKAATVYDVTDDVSHTEILGRLAPNPGLFGTVSAGGASLHRSLDSSVTQDRPVNEDASGPLHPTSSGRFQRRTEEIVKEKKTDFLGSLNLLNGMS